MKGFQYSKEDIPLSIDQDQVAKFYQEREQQKNRFKVFDKPLINLKTLDITQGSNKNLYRRKSLMSRLKQDSSIVASFNTSMSQQAKEINLSNITNDQFRKRQFFANNKITDAAIEKKTYLVQTKEHKKPFNGLENFLIIPEPSQSKNNQDNFKRRCNSVTLKRKKQKEFQPLQKNQKETIPLSAILKKYQQQVNQMENYPFQPQSKLKETKKSFKNESYLGENYQQKQNCHSNRRDNQQNSFDASNALLSLHVKTDAKSQNQIKIEKHQQWQQHELANSNMKTQKNQFSETNEKNFMPNSICKSIDILSPSIEQKMKQYEEKIKSQEQKINNLEKQNTYFKKFIQSIQKMKLTLEKTQTNQQVKVINQSICDSKKNSHLNVTNPDKNQECQERFNLKELWRWIKSLPVKKQNQKSKLPQCSLR